MRARVEAMASLIATDQAAVQFFLDGNSTDDRRYTSYTAGTMFELKGAVAALNAKFWAEAMAMTDVYDCMPQKRRDEWSTSIREHKTPDFTAEAVRPTILELLNSRHKFLAERVDGIFRGLSGEHVTNAPEAFGKRMILNYVFSSYTHSDKVGLVNDLRCVIAKFMGRTEPGWNMSSQLIGVARRNYGEWMNVDGGAMRIRVYKKGTAHLEVHPDMAWRLNSILAHLYPLAIPAQFRQKPVRKSKDFQMIQRPLPGAVVAVIADMRRVRNNQNAMEFGYTDYSDVAKAEATKVLESLGGVQQPRTRVFDFEYDPRPVLDIIIASGCVPDQKSHQFYPTPESVARVAVDMADIRDADTVLEPSAGHGDLAEYLPKERTTCVELSALRCAVLKARGFTTAQADFLEWAPASVQLGRQYDRVVMNPPFSDGRAQDHATAAATLVKPGGRLVAVLPASMKGKDVLPGWSLEWSEVLSNEFAGTSVSVVVLAAQKEIA